MQNGRPLSRRQAVQLMVALTLLAWATQTLFHQWGYGQEVPADVASPTRELTIPTNPEPATDQPPTAVAPPTDQAAPADATPEDTANTAVAATPGSSDDGAPRILPAIDQAEAEQPQMQDRFVSTAAAGPLVRGTLSLRPDSTVSTPDIKIRNICRWSTADDVTFASVADLTVVHLTGDRLLTNITQEQLKDTLSGAGMNLAAIDFAGATTCAVTASPQAMNDAAAMQQWAAAHAASADHAAGNAPPDGAAASVDTSPTATPVAPANMQGIRTLRDLLLADLCLRLQLPASQVQLDFNSADEAVLNLVEPYFHFDITPRRVRNLGDVSWQVGLVENGESHHVEIDATARLWTLQTEMIQPVDYRQIIRNEDVVEKRILSDHINEDTWLTKSQVVGQTAAMNLKPGTILTGRMVDPVLLARPGQLVTITVTQGNVRVTSIARAMESGSFGQTIRVRDDSEPPQIFQVTLTGPQIGTVSPTPDP